ncbi:MAG TPA: diguanylate cyclase [Actinotalea sp.]
MQDGPRALALVLVAVVCVGTAIATRGRFRHSPVRELLAAALLLDALWCIADAATRPGEVGAHRVVVAFAVVAAGYAAAALWCLSRVLTDPTWRPRRVVLGGWATAWALLCLAASEVGALVPVPSWHASLVDVLESVSVERLLLVVALLAAFGRLFRSRRHVPTFARTALRAISLALLLAAVTAGATVPVPAALGGVDYAPLGFALAGLVCADVLMRRGYLRIAPPSPDQVLDSLTDAVVVLEPGGRILAMNQAAHHLAAGPSALLPMELLLGSRAAEVLHPCLATVTDAPAAFAASWTLASGTHLDVLAHDLVGRSGERLGVVVAARDVTQLAARNAHAEAAYRGLERERDRLESVVSHLVAELSETERARTELAEDAVRDSLTGLHNRRRLIPTIEAAIDQSRVTGRPFAVLMVDVDHFKRVNDTHGHPVGDRVLQAVARELMITTGPGESVVRYGGEEFVVVVPGVGSFDAVRRAEEIRSAVADLRVPLRADRPGGDLSVAVTVSIGVSSHPHQGAVAEELIAAADDALLAAKAGGRNCVTAA